MPAGEGVGRGTKGQDVAAARLASKDPGTDDDDDPTRV